jgi:hypothetical protein
MFRGIADCGDKSGGPRRVQNMDDADKIVIEGKSSGTQLIQDLQNDGVWKVVEYKPPPAPTR